MRGEPAGYLAIERVLVLWAVRDEGNARLAARLDGIQHPAAAEAAELLRAGERGKAERVLERALLRLAGPAEEPTLDWWHPGRPPEVSGVAQPGGTTMF